MLQGVHHLQASCRAVPHTAGRASWFMPLCACCCRARTFIEPVTAFICDMLPEHMRETSRMDKLYEDIGPCLAVQSNDCLLFHTSQHVTQLRRRAILYTYVVVQM